MDWIEHVVEIIIHFDKYLNVVIQNFGHWSYLLLFVIIFGETGLVVTPFLPGDSLLFAVGAFAALGSFNLFWLLVILVTAAVTGNTVNYAIGNLIGEKITRNEHPRFLKKEYLDRTRAFYAKHGGKAIVLSRFIPIIRTFAPFVAGIGKMGYRWFFIYNTIGAVLWVCLFVLGGYYFGNMPWVKHNFSLVIMAIIVISLLPAVFEVWRHRRPNGSNRADDRSDKDKRD